MAELVKVLHLKVEQALTSIIASILGLKSEDIEIEDQFSDYGLDAASAGCAGHRLRARR